MNYTKSVEKWGVFEFCSEGTTAGNPFLERSITALFESDSERKTVNGFYDGNGIYKVRFMPSFEEEYHFTVCGIFLTVNTKELFLSRRRRKIITAA